MLRFLKTFKRIKELENENRILQDELILEKQEIRHRYLDIKKKWESLDPSPNGSDSRKIYTAKVAGFYSDILRDKLECMMAEQKDKLAMVGLPDWEYNLYRSCTNVMSLLLDWGDLMQTEFMSYAQEEKEKSEGDKSEEKLKEALK